MAKIRLVIDKMNLIIQELKSKGLEIVPNFLNKKRANSKRISSYKRSLFFYFPDLTNL
jgi:hypothetical protein